MQRQLSALSPLVRALTDLTTVAMVKVLDAALYELQTRLVSDSNLQTRVLAQQVLQARGVLHLIAKGVQRNEKRQRITTVIAAEQAAAIIAAKRAAAIAAKQKELS